MEFSREQYLRQLIKGMWNGKVKVVTGIRRCGKSYLLFNLFRRYLISEGVAERDIITIDLEDYGNRRLRNPDVLYDFVKSKVDGGKQYLLIDEIQYVDNFSDVLNGFRHIDNLDTYVTGSNSKMLSSDVVTEFRGRGYEVRVHPLSFSEIYQCRGDKDGNAILAEYMTYGGLPEVVTESDVHRKNEILKDLVKRIYLMDIAERANLKSDTVLMDIFDVISSTVGSPVNPKKISDTLNTNGISTSVSTVSKYITLLEDAYIFERSMRYDIKGRRYIGGSCKYYCEDLGLRNARINFRQPEYTHLMENMIYNELRIRKYDVDVGVVNDRSVTDQVRSSKQFEIDFVVNGWNKRYYIQSVYSLYDESKTMKETRPFEGLKDGFRRMVVVHDNIMSWTDENGVMFMGIIDFLTNDKSLDL